jgi:hypothetical protein
MAVLDYFMAKDFCVVEKIRFGVYINTVKPGLEKPI